MLPLIFLDFIKKTQIRKKIPDRNNNYSHKMQVSVFMESQFII